MAAYELSTYQKAIQGWVRDRVSHKGWKALTVNAVAGSGKTHTLTKIVVPELAANPSTQILMLAFNTSIKETLARSMTDYRNVTVSTMHGLGFRMIRDEARKRGSSDLKSPNDKKYQQIAWGMCEQHPLLSLQAKNASYKIGRIIDFGRLNMLSEDDWRSTGVLYDLVMEYDLDEPDWTQGLADNAMPGPIWRAIFQMAPDVLEQGRRLWTSVVDFVDMLYLPIHMGFQMRPYDWVLVDELQDLSTLQQTLLLKAVDRDRSGWIGVGDPNQSIYLFAGADGEAFNRATRMMQADTLPLSVNYRCGQEMIKIAQRFVPRIEAQPGAIMGEIVNTYQDKLHEILSHMEMEYQDTAILCRRTAPLISMCLSLIAKRIPARVRGRDIGKGLVELAEKVLKRTPLAEAEFQEKFLPALTSYVSSEMTMYSKYPNPETKVQRLRDRADALEAMFMELHFQSLSNLKKEIDAIFDDTSKGVVELMTIHKSKGGEWKRVFILDWDSLPMKWRGQTDEQAQQETNLMYVACTRAKEYLGFVSLTNAPKELPKKEGAIELPASAVRDAVAPPVAAKPAMPKEDVLRTQHALKDLLMQLELDEFAQGLPDVAAFFDQHSPISSAIVAEEDEPEHPKRKKH